MNIIIKSFHVAILISTATVFSTCTPRFDCAETKYTFELGVRAFPDEDSINIGDTIWFEINESTTLKDIQSGKMIDYSGAENLGSAIAFIESVDSVNSIGAVNDFKLRVIEGQQVTNPINPSINQEYIFNEDSGKYKFKLEVIANKTGRFAITISNAANVYRESDKCTKASFAINFEETDQHLYYLQIWGPDLIIYDSTKVYYFKVH